MRSALICVFFTLVVQRDGSCSASAENEEDFKPTPIPLRDWPRGKLEPAGTLQEIIKTETPVAAVPAHYWEDALRHSVYLTLVRDKIDQLIAKGDYISPNSKPENMVAKEIDDHDLWDKIKTARFDRLKEEPIPPADVTILARGRLVEDVQGYRFIEDDAKNNCSDSSCTKGVKALWSVKRMRQGETSPEKYHYELTFSVTSQTGERKVKKPYENPVRTFTIKETTPPVDRQQVRPHGKTIYHQERPQRAIWVHRNINPIPSYQKRPAPNTRGLDRIFSSLFSDEDSYEEPYRHKPKTFYSNVYPQHAKVAHIDDREPYNQKKLLPYPKPQSHRYTHTPIVVPPPPKYVQHPYLTADAVGNLPYLQTYTDNRYLPSNIIKTTRPAVLPTPITNYPLLKESTIEVPVKTNLNGTEYTTKEPDVVTTYKIYHHQKLQPPMKISYVSDHIRPPVYNAPPGVFVTMDKKPFKPMPPLKYSHMNKQQKPALPDFRPSPQVLDTQFSEQDSSADTAFRPIMDFSEDDFNDNDFSILNNENVRKPGASKKPGKKHEHIKSTQLSIVTPEIITAESVTLQEDDITDDDNEMEWANILGAFTKTTPMASHREHSTKEIIDTITSTTPLSTTVKDIFKSLEEFAESSEEEEITSTSSTTTTTTTTTPKPKKRTRPPPKFNKTEKIKKHKRVTSTTTTLKPTRKYPSKKPTDDLTPQASSAATSSTNSIRETKTHKPPASTTTSSTTPRPTTTVKLTTTSTSGTTSTSSPTVDTEQPVVTTQPKSKNRFRQSTLMQKGTSVNHDKWSTSTFDKNRTNTATSHSYPLRRKASKFTGYIPASTPRSPEVERNREDHRDHVYSFNKERISSTTEKVDDDILVKNTLPPTQPTDERLEIKDDPHSEWSLDDESEQQEEKGVTEIDHRRIPTDVQESKDDTEYIFPTASVIQEVKEYIGLTDEAPTTELTVVASPYSATKNKTKCKKKKHNNLTTTEGAIKSLSEPEASDTPETSSKTTTTASPVTPDIFNELFGGFTMDDVKEEPATERSTPAPEGSSSAAEQKSSESEKHERYLHLDDDLEEFLYSLDKKSNHQAHDDKLDEDYDDDDDNLDDESSPYNIDEESKQFKEDYYEDAQESQDQPFSLLELMDME